MLSSRFAQEKDGLAQYVKGNELSLANQNLTLADIPHIVSFIKKNPQILKLNLSENNLDDEAMVALAKGCQKIKSINLSANKISAEGVVTIAKLPVLIDLNLSDNLITDEGAMALANHPTLICLKLINCGIKGFGVSAFAENQVLTQLDVSRNGDEKRRDKSDIAKLLEKNSKLTKLIVNGYLLSQQDLVAINKHIKRVQLDTVSMGLIAEAVGDSEWTPMEVKPEKWEMVNTKITAEAPVKDKDWDVIKKREFKKSELEKANAKPDAQPSTSWFSFSFLGWKTKNPADVPDEKKVQNPMKG